MVTKLSNSIPGTISKLLSPGRPLFFGLKSETGDVNYSSIRTTIGYSNFVSKGKIPTTDPYLMQIGAQTSIQTPERVLPAVSATFNTETLDGISMTKTNSTDEELGIFEIKIPLDSEIAGTPILGYFKFKIKSAWNEFAPSWTNTNKIVCPYFGLEHSMFNTAAYMFLRRDATRSIVMGGIQPAAFQAREGQQEVNYAWDADGNNSVFEMWIYFNTVGYETPFVPTLTPIVEFWTKRQSDTVITKHPPIVLGDLGQFPGLASGAFNYREAPEESATLFFGNAGRSSDQLEVLDWAIFPDFRVGVMSGASMFSTSRLLAVDTPALYEASSNKVLTESIPTAWYPITDAGFIPPYQKLHYQPGRKQTAQFTRLIKINTNRSGVFKYEPRLDVNAPVSNSDGSSLELNFSANSDKNLYSTSTGAAFSIEDGDSLFKVKTLMSGGHPTLGIQKSIASVSDLYPGYIVPLDALNAQIDIDWRVLKRVKLAVDRKRALVTLEVDGTEYLSIPYVPADFPVSTNSRIAIGFLDTSPDTGRMDINYVRYNINYRVWDSSDTDLPPVAAVSSPPGAAFTLSASGAGNSSFDANNVLLIDKQTFNTVGSRRFYEKTDSFDEVHGLELEFSAKVNTYTNINGRFYASNTEVGSGVKVWFGDKVLHFGFFDCGVQGKVIGIEPLSGVEDIINQTATGKRYSARVDWSQFHTYRISYRPFDSLKVWVDTLASTPIIEIPWVSDTDRFEIKEELASPKLQFGHFSEDTSSLTEWKFVRWSNSYGYELSVLQGYPYDIKGYLFGGKLEVLMEFDE